MQFRTVLHITDLHVNDPKSADEILRNGHYLEYIRGFVNRINEAKLIPDCIVATGDFVHRGKGSGYGHAEKVLAELAKQLCLKKNNIVVCPGNHDIDKTVDYDFSKGRKNPAMLKYWTFAKKFAREVVKSSVATLYEPAPDIFALMIDTTQQAISQTTRSIANASKAVDEIMQLLESAKLPQLLLIGSHYPHGCLESLAVEEPAFRQKHESLVCSLLLRRLGGWNKIATPVLWLCGDIHYSEEVSNTKCITVVTSHFGGVPDAPTDRHSHTTVVQVDGTVNRYISSLRQAKVIEWGEHIQRANVFQYGREGATEDASRGEWMCVRRTRWSSERVKDEMPKPKILESVEVLDERLDNDIHDEIASRQLLRLGRFHSTYGHVNLTWVSMNRLMNVPSIYIRIGEGMAQWINSYAGIGQYRDGLIIGMDHWGSALASYVSSRTNIPSTCIGVRGRGNFHASSEKINEEVLDLAKNVRNIFVITDVIATGHSIEWVHNKISTELADTQRQWACLSVLCDSYANRGNICSFASSLVTACASIRMPIISEYAMPDVACIPPDISVMDRNR